MSSLAAVVFDFDGIIIDSETPEYESHRRIFDRCGVPDHDAYHAEKRRIFDEVVPDAPMRGIGTLLRQLAGAGIPAAIASSSPASWVVGTTERLGLRPLFGAIVTGEDVVRRKPAPDVYLEAARRLGADPARSIAVEDSGPGIAAARAAGMKTIAIPHWLTEGHDLLAADLRVAHAGELTLERLMELVEQK